MTNKNKGINENGLYSSRYQAQKAMKNDPYLHSNMVIVKVDGGYKVMEPSDYNVWRKQK